MAGNQSNHNLHLGKFEISQRAKTMSFAFIAIGILTFVVGLLKNQDRIWASYLTSFFFFACLGLGGLFFAAIQHVVNAGWSVTIRRLSESMTSFIPAMLIGSLVLIGGIHHLYSWSNPEVIAASKLVQSKTAYLNVPFFVVRMLIFGIGCLIFRQILVGASIKQDQTGDESITVKATGYGVKFLLFFAILFSLFSVDLLMSLLPIWYSTIFGIYTFSGLFQSSLAALLLLMMWVRKKGLVKGYITDEHTHDVAKYLKGFTVFWAYIAFSQFMLIWYANIPEETEFFIMRSQNGWMGVSLALLIFKFIVPFLALLPRWAKRNHSHLIAVCILILFMQYIDIMWLVYPNFFEGHFVFGFWEIGMFLGFAGIFMYGINKFLSSNNIVPIKDPRLQEAINHHVTY